MKHYLILRHVTEIQSNFIKMSKKRGGGMYLTEIMLRILITAAISFKTISQFMIK